MGWIQTILPLHPIDIKTTPFDLSDDTEKKDFPGTSSTVDEPKMMRLLLMKNKRKIVYRELMMEELTRKKLQLKKKSKVHPKNTAVLCFLRNHLCLDPGYDWVVIKRMGISVSVSLMRGSIVQIVTSQVLKVV